MNRDHPTCLNRAEREVWENEAIFAVEEREVVMLVVALFIIAICAVIGFVILALQ